MITNKINNVKYCLKSLTSKSNIFFTDRGNTSILLALKLAKHIGKKKLFIQDQGGWLTYEQFAKKLKFEYHFLDTDYGIVQIKNLKQHIDKDSVLLINSLPGYFCVQENMKEIYELCKEKNCFLINDISGSIGKDVAKYGDLVIGSFGRWKPINIEYGGFIAFDNKEYNDFLKKNFSKELKDFYKELNDKLSNLSKRLKQFDKITTKIKKQLHEFEIIHKESKGINVIVKFSSLEQKMKIIDYCKLYNFEYTECPRYIRVMDNAISIEVKRL